MEWQGWLTLAVVLLTLYAMVKELAGPDLILMGGLFTPAAFRVLTPREAFEGFANPALATVGSLFIVWAALIVVYLTALLLAELLHHNAAVALIFPIAVETANLVGAAPSPRIRDGGGTRWLVRVRFAGHRPDTSDRLRPGRLPVHRFRAGGRPRSTRSAR
jgi:hypothetical protein